MKLIKLQILKSKWNKNFKPILFSNLLIIYNDSIDKILKSFFKIISSNPYYLKFVLDVCASFRNQWINNLASNNIEEIMHAIYDREQIEYSLIKLYVFTKDNTLSKKY